MIKHIFPLILSISIILLPILSNGQSSLTDKEFETLLKGLKAKNIETVKRTCKILGEMKDLRAVEPLIKLLKNKESSKRAYAAEALGEIENKKAVEPLIKSMLKYKGCFAREKSAEALGKIGDPLAIDPLFEAWDSFSFCGDEFKVAIINAIGNIGGNRSIEFMIKSLKSESEIIFKAASEVIIKSNNPIAIEFISNEPDENSEGDQYISMWVAKHRFDKYYRDYKWQTAKSINTYKSYENFLTEYPISPYIREAFTNLDQKFNQELASRYRSNWEQVCKQDNIESYEQFLTNNPSSKYIGDARKRLSEIGTNLYLDSIWDRSSETLKSNEEKIKKKLFHPMILISVITEDITPRIIYMDEHYMYNEIIDGVAKNLSNDYEFPKSKYSNPFEVVIIYIPQTFANDLMKLKKNLIDNEEISNSFFELIDILSLYIDADNDKLNILLLSPISLLPKYKYGKTLSQSSIIAAFNESEINLLFDVNKPITVYDTEVAKMLVQKLGESLNTIELIEDLLFINSPYGYDILESANNYVIELLVKIRYKDGIDDNIRNRADSALILIGNPAIPFISYELYIHDHRLSAIAMLRKIGGPLVIPHLVYMLMEWDIKYEVLQALRLLHWNPKTYKEKVFYAVAKRDREALIDLDDWTKTKDLLFKEVYSRKRPRIESAVYSFMAIGNVEIIPDLISILATAGNKEMAETFLNSGHWKLTDAAENWAKRHGYHISSGHGAGEAKWGKY